MRTVPVGERLPIYDVYLKRASDFFGIGKVRCLAAAESLHSRGRKLAQVALRDNTQLQYRLLSQQRRHWPPAVTVMLLR